MALHTPMCDLLGIEYPIFAAGMGGVTMAPLTAAISAAIDAALASGQPSIIACRTTTDVGVEVPSRGPKL